MNAENNITNKKYVSIIMIYRHKDVDDETEKIYLTSVSGNLDPRQSRLCNGNGLVFRFLSQKTSIS